MTEKRQCPICKSSMECIGCGGSGGWLEDGSLFQWACLNCRYYFDFRQIHEILQVHPSKRAFYAEWKQGNGWSNRFSLKQLKENDSWRKMDVKKK